MTLHLLFFYRKIFLLGLNRHAEAFGRKLPGFLRGHDLQAVVLWPRYVGDGSLGTLGCAVRYTIEDAEDLIGLARLPSSGRVQYDDFLLWEGSWLFDFRFQLGLPDFLGLVANSQRGGRSGYRTRCW